jgi:hypothetical protein
MVKPIVEIACSRRNYPGRNRPFETMKSKESKQAQGSSAITVDALKLGAIEDKLWQTAVEAAIPFEFDQHGAHSVRGWIAIGAERMDLEGRLSPGDFVTAETNLRGFVQLMKSEGIFIGHTDRLDDECFRAAHRRLKRSSILAQVTLWPFWPSHLVADQ